MFHLKTFTKVYMFTKSITQAGTKIDTQQTEKITALQLRISITVQNRYMLK